MGSQFLPRSPGGCISVIIVILLFEWLLLPAGTWNLAKEPYRRKERNEAAKAYRESPSPTTKATYDSEQRLIMDYLRRRHNEKKARIFAVLVVIDALGIYCLWSYGRRKREQRAPPWVTGPK